MTEEEAISRLQARICCEQPIQHFCTDNCMHGTDKCEVAMAIEALKKRIPKKPVEVRYSCSYIEVKCPNCGAVIDTDYHFPHCCSLCGQALNWKEE